MSSSNSAPGPDGLDYNFYKTHWKLLKDPLLAMMNQIINENTLCQSFNDGIIILIPKTTPAKTMRDYRPITLLNTDYKLLMKILANRMKRYMDHLIKEGQTCGVPGRSIIQNIQTIRNIIMHYEINKHEKAAILSLDFQKAFDNVNHQYLFAVLEKYGFPPKIVRTIKVLYHNAHSRIQINGFLSNPIKIEKSVRQGCPLSMILFVLCLDPFIRMVNNNLTVFPDPMNFNAIIAYADDVTVLLRNEACLRQLPQMITLFEQASNAKVNFSKSTLLPLGTWPPDVTLQNIQTNSQIKILGLIIKKKLQDTIDANWTEIVNNVRGVIIRQMSRNLNVIQKIWHVNTFALSKIWYIAQVLPMPEKFSQRVELTIGYYIWKGYMFRVHRNQLRQPIENGGFKLINVQLKCNALLMKNIIKAFHDKGSYQDIQFWKTYVQNVVQLPIQFRPFKKILSIISSLNYDPQNQQTFTSKFLYTRLMESSENDIRIMNKYPALKWKQIWKTFKIPHTPTDWKVTAYEVVNEIIATDVKKFHHSITTSPICEECGHLDTILHRLITCQKVKNIWKWLSETLNQAVPSANLNTSRKLLLHMEVDRNSNTFIQVMFASAYIHSVLKEKQCDVANLVHKIKSQCNRISNYINSDTKKLLRDLLK